MENGSRFGLPNGYTVHSRWNTKANGYLQKTLAHGSMVTASCLLDLARGRSSSKSTRIACPLLSISPKAQTSVGSPEAETVRQRNLHLPFLRSVRNIIACELLSRTPRLVQV